MRQVLQDNLKHVSCIDEVEVALLEILARQKQVAAGKRIGFVSGSLFSNGPEYVELNMRRLEEYTDQLRAAHPFPLFSAYDVFYCGLTGQLREYKGPMEARRPRLITFWKNIITSGHITDIFMTPGWERSEGAKDEFKNAQNAGLKVHLLHTL